jgi:hypothetical protein
MTSKNCTLCNVAPQAGKYHKRCTTCSAPYCSSACQRQDWKYHKHVCSVYGAFIATAPRPDNHLLAFLLPEKSKSVQCVWVLDGTDLADYHLHNFMRYENDEQFVGVDTVEVSLKLERANPNLHKFALDHRVELKGREEAAKNGSASNECVIKIMKGVHPWDWKGPLLIFSRPGLRGDVFQDVTTSDLRVVVDYFKRYSQGIETIREMNPLILQSIFYNGQKTMFETNTADDAANNTIEAVGSSSSSFGLSTSGNEVSIVRINDKGRIQFNGAAKFVEIMAHKSNEIFEGKPTSISKHLEIPLVLRKCQPGTEWPKGRDSMPFDPDENIEALDLMRDVEPSSSCFGFLERTARLLIVAPVGSFLVARKDRQNITAKQVEVFSRFYKEKLCDSIQYLSEETENWEKEERVAHKAQFVKTHICRSEFEKFFEEYKSMKIASGDASWINAMSPYVV